MWGTIYRWFTALRDSGRFKAINHALVMVDRERAAREASPSGAIIDSQSVKTTEAGGSSNASSHGSIATGVLPRTSRRPSHPPGPSSMPHP